MFKIIKKTLALLIAVSMLFILPIAAFSADDVSQIIADDGMTIVGTYDDIKDAFDAVQDGETIKLLKDITYSGSIKITGITITIETNGNTLLIDAAPNGTALTVDGGNVYLNNEADGEFNVVGGSGSGRGLVVTNGGHATVTNASQVGGASTSARTVYATGPSSTVTVLGNAIGGFYSLGAENGASIMVLGNVSGGGGMLVSGVGTSVVVFGYSSGGGTGVLATDGASVFVGGNVYGGGYGVYAESGAQVTVNGAVKAYTGDQVYIRVGGADKMQEDYEPTSSKDGYFEYQRGISNVWVKYFDPPLVRFTVTYAPGEHGDFDAQEHTGLKEGAETPEPPTETPGKPGWIFDSWSPEVSEFVTADETYTAQWTPDGSEVKPPLPPPPPPPDPAPITVALESVKTVSGEGAAMTDKKFNFAIYEDGEVVATGSNDAGGAIIFSEIEYDEPGTHEYLIKETSSGLKGWMTDDSEYNVTVNIKNRNNRLVAEIDYHGGGFPSFHNHYIGETATLKVSKTMVDADGNIAGSGLEFYIILYEKTLTGSWSMVGEYALSANSHAVAITGLQGGKTYQIVEKTNDWYTPLGYHMSIDRAPVGSVGGPSMAFYVPPLTNSMSIDVVISNMQTDDPSGTPGGGMPDEDPPNVDITDTDIPMVPFIDEHHAYIIGYADGKVGPDRNITRAEVATIFFRLLTDDVRREFWTNENPFPDVSPAMWHNNAISVMHNLGVIKGYPDGTYKPGSPITRAEFATIVARFARMMRLTAIHGQNFSDLGRHWAQSDINYAASIGWVNGYPDETFRPNRSITRAETMTLVNRVLGRIPEHADDLLVGEMIVWVDNADPSAWYYLAIQEATTSHIPESKDKPVPGQKYSYESWLERVSNRDWALLERAWTDDIAFTENW